MLYDQFSEAYGPSTKCPNAHNALPGDVYWQREGVFIRLQRSRPDLIDFDVSLGKGCCNAAIDPSQNMPAQPDRARTRRSSRARSFLRICQATVSKRSIVLPNLTCVGGRDMFSGKDFWLPHP